MVEIYKNINGFPNFAISNYGNVLHNKTLNISKKFIDSGGYYFVNLWNDGCAKTYRIHRLVGEYFIPNPKNLQCIDHKNRIRTDNNIQNLRWVTHQENMRNRTKRKNCSSIYVGVRFRKDTNRWNAYTKIDGKHMSLGCFSTELEAAKAYNDYIINNNLESFVLNNI